MNSRIQALKDELLTDMLDYMKHGGAEDETDPEYDPEFDAGYTQQHIDHCSKILDDYFGELARAPQDNKKAAITAAVRNTVLALNTLNEDCDMGLIETDQRELLCEIILSAAHEAGLPHTSGDITEEWREW
jgi:hypothetical protein